VLIFRVLKETLGETAPVRSSNRDDCRRIRKILIDLAPNYTKLAETKGLTMEEAARVSRELDLPRRSTAGVNTYLINLAAIMNYGRPRG
jgi:hypothetical protein